MSNSSFVFNRSQIKAIVGALWGECDWGNNDVDIDVNRYNNINANNRITNNQNKWQHNAAHRNGVPYRDNRSREQYGRQLGGASQRQAYRGDNAQRAQARENARSSMDRHGIERPATSNLEARDRARSPGTWYEQVANVLFRKQHENFTND
mgnify:CR=1 FL=1